MQRTAHTRGHAAAALGALIGSAALGAAGAAAGLAFAERTIPDAELEKLGPFLVGLAAGVWIGGVAGCALALRARGHAGAGATARMLAVLLPVGVGITVLATPLLKGASPAGWAAGVAAAAVAARGLTGRSP